MSLRDQINNEYFEWLYDMMCGKRYSEQLSFRKLFMHLHDTEFTFSIPNDENRAEDGVDLRYRFVRFYLHDREDFLDYLDGPCSVLEMMVALAMRMEETIMDDPRIGDRTGQWFWSMIVNLGIGSMTDSRYDKKFVSSCLDIFLEREYEPNGRGGLFTVRHCKRDLRDVEIWNQMQWYLNEMI